MDFILRCELPDDDFLNIEAHSWLTSGSDSQFYDLLEAYWTHATN